MNKDAKIPCILTTVLTLFISSIESHGVFIMVGTNNNTTPLMMKY
jgi:hypothetical protein